MNLLLMPRVPRVKAAAQFAQEPIHLTFVSWTCRRLCPSNPSLHVSCCAVWYYHPLHSFLSCVDFCLLWLSGTLFLTQLAHARCCHYPHQPWVCQTARVQHDPHYRLFLFVPTLPERASSPWAYLFHFCHRYLQTEICISFDSESTMCRLDLTLNASEIPS